MRSKASRPCCRTRSASSSASRCSSRRAVRIASATSRCTRRSQHHHAVETYGMHFPSRRPARRRILPCGRYFDGLAADYAAHEPDVLIVNVLRFADAMNVDHLTWDDARRVVEEVSPRVAIFQHFGTKMLEAGSAQTRAAARRRSWASRDRGVRRARSRSRYRGRGGCRLSSCACRRRRLVDFFGAHEREALRAFYEFPVVWHEQAYGFAAVDGEETIAAGTLSSRHRLATSSASSSRRDHRRAGLGRAILAEMADVANYYNCHKMTVMVPHLRSAQKLFRSLRLRRRSRAAAAHLQTRHGHDAESICSKRLGPRRCRLARRRRADVLRAAEFSRCVELRIVDAASRDRRPRRRSRWTR